MIPRLMTLPPLECEICGDPKDVRKAPIMTGVPFNAPRVAQRYVCRACFDAWYDGAGVTAEAIRKRRGIT